MEMEEHNALEMVALTMVQWPYGHKWPNMAKMAIYGHLAIGLYAKNMGK